MMTQTKKDFAEPDIQIVKFSAEDILSTSSGDELLIDDWTTPDF